MAADLAGPFYCCRESKNATTISLASSVRYRVASCIRLPVRFEMSLHEVAASDCVSVLVAVAI